MKSSAACVVVMLTVLSFSCLKADGDRSGRPLFRKGGGIQAYLGQDPPGMEPKVFSPGTISSDQPEHGYVAVSPSGKEIYWSRISADFQQGAIWRSEWRDGSWTPPQIAPFSSMELRDLCPVFSSDGQKLFFTSMRPVGGEKGYNLWVATKKDGVWEEPLPLDSVINHGRESGCTVTADGSLYFMAWEEGDFESCDIYCSKFSDGRYLPPERLGRAVNSAGIETTPFISPDGSYLLFSSRREGRGFGGFDLYVSFRGADDAWTEAINLGGRINTGTNEWFPSVSPDGKYIFYNSGMEGNDDVYWVSAEILAGLKAEGENGPDSPPSDGLYLGQTPPGEVPEVFAPGVVSTEHRDHSDLLFSPDGREIYWSAARDDRSSAIMTVRYAKNRWSPPEIAPFSSPDFFDCIPCFSNDGKRLYFSSWRPLPGSDSSGKLNIWHVDRRGGGWSEPVPLDSTINHPGHDSNPVVAADGTLYFGSDRPGGKGSWDIYRSRWADGRFSRPENLGDGVNSDKIEICSDLDPGGRFLLFTAYDRADGYGSGDIYISFRENDGTWGRAVNLGRRINTEHEEAFGRLSPDGRVLFFGSDRNGNFDVYWIDARAVKGIKK